ncbi:GNAT family N-acetyltransferase [Gracilibacillus sp. YIM 98692]|uniref:GNAT family N-acetyltransferase n=1 Tax=Gracilibacillus sp. YIM 98692 TaxID=2663532 RepID=UPI0013D6F7D6|nr:GNAT family N-acetyltransferase [Gracilibacillus sp. YIM 98692]
MPVRPYIQGDEHQIIALFEKVFGHKISLDEWKWKFLQTPNDSNPFILLYEENDQILGHISLWVQDAFIDKKKTKIGTRVDTMVDPDARGKGIYKQLNQALLPYAEEEGIELLYGFPAETAKKLFIRYTNAQHIVDVPRLMYILRPVEAMTKKFSFLKWFKLLDQPIAAFRLRPFKQHHDGIQEITRCDERFDALQENGKAHFEVKLNRHKDYLNWRYFDHPERNYQMLAYIDNDEVKGYMVYRITEPDANGFCNGMLIDMDVADWDNDKVIQALIETAVTRMKKATVIQAWALSHMPTYHRLKKYGFIHKDSPMPMVAKETTADPIYTKDIEKWYITNGDLDSF